MIRKFLAGITWGVLASVLGSVCTLAADNPEMTRFTVSFKSDKEVVPKSKKPPKFAPELRALMHVEGKLVGRTLKGEAVIEAQKKHADTLESQSVEIGLTVGVAPENFTPINRLILSYEAGKKPTELSLKKAGLRIAKDNDFDGDYEKGTLLIVEPIEQTGITSKTVVALDANKEVTKAYPSHRIQLPPQPPKDAGAEKKVEKQSKRIKVSQAAPMAPGFVTPNDPQFGQLWGIKKINAPVAWTSTTSSPVIVAVIDTGIDYNHPDLKPNLWTSPSGAFGFNAIPGKDPDDPYDDNGHGTHCAGTIAAIGNNNFGVAGVSWNVKVMGLKFLDSEGSGEDFDAIRCIDFAIENGAKVLSNSWGGYGEVPELEEAIGRAQLSGALFIAAASNDHVNNDGANPSFPSSYEADNIISVMSIDPNGGMSSFSNYGARSVDLAAPGRDILSTLPAENFDTKSGTSMATPHVAGAAALLWGHPKYKLADWSEIKTALLQNVSKTSALTNRCLSGGILDLKFIGGQPKVPSDPSKPLPAAGSVLLASEKFVDPIQVTDKANVLKIHVELTEACDVLIRADSSITASANIRNVSTGFLNEEALERRWQGSARRMSVKADRWTPVVASYVVRLESGSHDLYWKVWDDDSTDKPLTMNAGTMTVEAIPARK